MFWVVSASVVSPLMAQEPPELPAQITSGLVTSAMNNAAMQNTLKPDARDPCFLRRSAPGCKTASQAGVSLSYAPDKQITRSLADQFLKAARSSDQATAHALAPFLVDGALLEAFARVARQAGVPTRDPSSSFAVYAVRNWAIANRLSFDPANPAIKAAIQGLRLTVRPALAANPQMANPGYRQIADEQMMLQCLMLDIIIAQNRAGGDVVPAAVAEQVAASWQQRFGQDLRRLKPAPTGLIPR